jgi:Na+-driven multidrug efflux pump
LFALTTPILLAFLFFSLEIFVIFDQTESVTVKASQCMVWMIPGLVFNGQFDLMRRWLLAMRVTIMPMVVSITSVFFQIPLTVMLVMRMDNQSVALGIAFSLSRMFEFVCM